MATTYSRFARRPSRSIFLNSGVSMSITAAKFRCNNCFFCVMV